MGKQRFSKLLAGGLLEYSADGERSGMESLVSMYWSSAGKLAFVLDGGVRFYTGIWQAAVGAILDVGPMGVGVNYNTLAGVGLSLTYPVK